MQAKSLFLKAKIQDNHHNTQKLWLVLGDVLLRLPAKIPQLIKPPQLLADRFVDFLTEKIAKIRSTFSASVNLQHITPESPAPMFSTFSTVTEDQVTKIITNSPSKSCSLDPWPTFLVLDYLDILITPITSIINASLEQGMCPIFFKQAHVTPILKKSSLDKDIFKKYRPVSNLNFISKILERVVAVQLQTHLDETGLMTAFQRLIEITILLKVPSIIFITIFFLICPKGLSLPLPFWIYPLLLIPLTTPFSWTDSMFIMESVS